MKYYIVTNRQIITTNGVESIDTTNDGECSNSLRFATLDSANADPNAYTLIPDKTNADPAAVAAPYYFNPNEPVKTGSERFFTELSTDMASADGGDLLVLIHGFNVDWAGGIGDLRNVENCFVTPANSKIKHLVLFSWPSHASLLRYKPDRQDAMDTGTTLARCFQLFTEFLGEAFVGPNPPLQPCGNNIHLICHSMGNYVLQNMLVILNSAGNKYHNVFEEVILAAADVDNNVFGSPNPFYTLNNLCRRVHIYCNHNDLVLKFSAKYENPLKRLGTDGPADLNVLPNHVYTVDCTDAAFARDKSIESRILQHDYFTMVQEASTDIFAVLSGEADEMIGNRTKVNDVKYRVNPYQG